MSASVISSKATLIGLLQALSFSGNGNIVSNKQDVFERPGGSVGFGELNSERLTMGDSAFERVQVVQLTVTETFASGDTENQLLTLALELERSVEASLLSGAFPSGLMLQMNTQGIDLLPDDPATGIISQIYTIEYNETLTPE